MITSREQQVVVFGAAGFIGRQIVLSLLARGWRVRAFIHVTETVPFEAESRIDIVRGDIRDKAAVRRAVAGCVAIVNAAGAKRDEPESEAVNVGGARNLADASREMGGIRILQISTQSVKIARQGTYARTKLAADRVLERSGVPFTLLRPSVVYGRGVSGVFSTMQHAIERWPVVPVFGDGQWISAPVHVADVAAAVAACLDRPLSVGRCYDLGGPERVTLDGLLDRIAARVGRRARKVHIPFPLALLLARVVACAGPWAPVTVSNVLGSNQATPMDTEPARVDLGFDPRPLDEGMNDCVTASSSGAADDLAAEAYQFANYLMDAEPSPEIVARYQEAVRTGAFGAVDRELRWVRRHGWLLPCFDAAGAFTGNTALRRRVLLMAALLETSTVHASWFLTEAPTRAGLLAGLAWRGVSSAGKLAAGLVLRTVLR